MIAAQRLAAVLCLALAALHLAADAGEYPGWSRAGLRALAHGALPLLVVGVVNLRAVGAGPRWRAAALACNVALLVVAVGGVRAGAPPFVWLLLGVSVLLVAASAIGLWMINGARNGTT